MHQCIKLFYFGMALYMFRPSSAVEDCIYSKRHMSNRYCCLLASKQTAVCGCCLYSLELLMMDGKTIRNM